MKKRVIVIGAGGHGRVLAELVKRNKDKFVGFLDDRAEGAQILGKIKDCTLFKHTYFIIGIGDSRLRKQISEKYCRLKFYTAVDPSAIVSKSIQIGEGSCVMPGAVINTGAHIGKQCIINTNSTVEHDAILQDYVHISPGAVVCGGAEIGKLTQIGARAVVRNQTFVTENCTIGMGAAVVHDIEESGVYVGVPAKKLN